MNSCLLSDTSCVFDRADPYAVSNYVNEHVGTHGIRLPNVGHPEASLNHRKFASLDLCRISYGGSVRVTSPALETIYHLQVLLRGHCLWRGQGEEHFFSPGELLLINPDDPVDLTYSDDCEKFIVKLPSALLDKTCRDSQWQRPEAGIRFAARHSLQQLDGFTGLLQLVCSEAESAQTVQQVQEQYTRIIATKLLTLLDNNVSRMVPEQGAASFERILQFIEDNLKQDISVEQLAQLAHSSPRSLYALFERHTGTTPKSFIRQKRLEKIHSSLSDPASRVRNITEVALDYGFLHLGRFSESYKNAFGELPSETLRRREA
jgi:AraC-like DNA-binding protein